MRGANSRAEPGVRPQACPGAGRSRKVAARMACYLFNFTRTNAKKDVALRTQAAELLRLGLWGIGPNTQNRKALAPGDQMVVFIGSPDRAFIGSATLASNVHPWAPDESRVYPAGFKEGVALTDVAIWDHPVPIMSVWPQTASARTNPGGYWQGGVARLPQDDYNHIVAAGMDGNLPAPMSRVTVLKQTAGLVPPPSAATSPTTPTRTADALFGVSERVRKYLVSGEQPLSEDATRAHFINRLLEALGYTEFNDIEYGVPVDSGDFTDYVLCVGQRVACVEAKRLDAPLGAKEAAQVIKYTSVLG